MKKKLLLIELNEFNLKFLKKGSKKYKCKNLLYLLKNLKYCRTFTKDKTQDYNLDPWVQWVSIHTGKNSTKHKIKRHGEILNKKIEQIWDVLSQYKISSCVWSPPNGVLRKKIKIFFPDPWSFKQIAYPKYLNNYLFLPRYYANNYTDFKFITILKYFFLFIFNFAFTIYFKSFLKFAPNVMMILFKSGLSNFSLFFIFDIINLYIFKHYLEKKKTNFNLIFLNSLAHFQHNNWDKPELEKFYFEYTDKIAAIILELKSLHNAIILTNGFSQKKINKKFMIRNKNPEKFIKFLNFKYQKVQTNMTNGGMIFFNSDVDKFAALNKLKSLRLFGCKFIKTEIKKKSIYYELDLKFKKKIDHNIKNSFNSIKSYVIDKPLKLPSKTDFEQSRKISKMLSFLKTTSRHTSNGDLFFYGINIKKKIIENHQIFSQIKSYFLNK